MTRYKLYRRRVTSSVFHTPAPSIIISRIDNRQTARGADLPMTTWWLSVPSATASMAYLLDRTMARATAAFLDAQIQRRAQGLVRQSLVAEQPLQLAHLLL